MTTLLRVTLAAAIYVSVTACGDDGNGGQMESACAQPQASVDVATGKPGQEIQVSGMNFFASCNDLGDGAPGPVLEALAVRFKQGSVTAELGKVRPNADGNLPITRATIPAAAVPGPAEIFVGNGSPARLLIGSVN